MGGRGADWMLECRLCKPEVLSQAPQHWHPVKLSAAKCICNSSAREEGGATGRIPGSQWPHTLVELIHSGFTERPCPQN